MRRTKLSKDITLRKFDLIQVGKYKYIVFDIKRNTVDLLPIDNLLDNDKPIDMIPMFSFEKKTISSHIKIDSNEFFYLLNQTNPLVIEALKSFLENEKE